MKVIKSILEDGSKVYGVAKETPCISCGAGVLAYWIHSDKYECTECAYAAPYPVCLTCGKSGDVCEHPPTGVRAIK